MPAILEGKLDASGKRFGIVVGRTNEILTTRLLEGALDCLRRHGARDEDIEVAWVPGSFEVPQLARRIAEAGRADAIVCLSVLVRGDTPHFDYLAAEIARGSAQVAMQTGIPVTFGVVTADNLEQGLARAGAKQGNKGWQAALSAIEMAQLMDVVAARPGKGRRRVGTQTEIA